MEDIWSGLDTLMQKTKKDGEIITKFKSKYDMDFKPYESKSPRKGLAINENTDISVIIKPGKLLAIDKKHKIKKQASNIFRKNTKSVDLRNVTLVHEKGGRSHSLLDDKFVHPIRQLPAIQHYGSS